MACKQERVAMTGNEAVANGMKQINPDVVAAYPITPQTDIVQFFSQFVADGLVKTELVTVESEHSAMSATIGASCGGARAMTATSSQGLALMWEMLHIASSYRLPIVMPVVNRALSAPINIHCDHGDTMGSLTTGWLQIYAENAQEVYDNLIQAVRIAEHSDILLPIMVCQDGFITSHGLENLQILSAEDVQKFIGDYKPEDYLLNLRKPITIGPLALQDYFTEFKVQQVRAMEKSKQVILDIAKEYEGISGRKYGLFEEYHTDDADRIIVVLTSTAGTAKAAVNKLRAKGEKVGLIKPRVIRPFPAQELVAALKDTKVVAIMDRAESFSTQGGPLFAEIRAAFYDEPKKPMMKNYVFGLGGRDVTVDDIDKVYSELKQDINNGRIEAPVTYMDVRE